MDNLTKTKLEAIDLFLKELHKKGSSNVTCPICKTKLEFVENGSSYMVKCQTQNCLEEYFRGILLHCKMNNF
ncbi:hypothetical protein [Ruminococcus flavefaciens]|uniref:hypothetical protein n=1 Tax=Ruminococcus flavefaciens TaxID=1265 RepID=UPI0026EB95BE|nr:hypothetical protein [Ruminococcus flavefaciens]